ncbi:MAG: hypothetical protein KGH64_06550, partial [Candidatus Micrarchaeota archaeon]|nr:hypothetical protein [Candidatus Micrarchaeota archaeon]
MHKLAILYGSDMRYYGGGEKYIIEFVNRLPEFDTTIFSFSGSGTFRMSLKQVSGMANAKIEYYTAFQIPVLKDKIILTASGLSTIWKVKDFDAVYCTENSILTELIMAALSRVYGFKYIQGLHDSNTLRDSPMQPGPIRDFLFGIYGKLRNLALLSIPNIRVVNYSDGDKLLKMGYKGRLYKITDFINVKAGAEKVRINRKKFTALFVGRLSINHKGIDLLSQIIEKLLDSN